ncbi:Alpha/Beta hydrolase protein [Mycena latifolia]|nr:Alpha/Beta hydrolase protein [Mycena latifolia]
MFLKFVALVAIFASNSAEASATNHTFNVKSFKIDLSSGIPHLKDLVRNIRLPALYPNAGPDKGIELDYLRELKQNGFKHYTAVIEGQTVHFVHEKSNDPDAIPVILLHGWPGFVFSSAPPENWIVDDTARIFNTLMTEVLGYSTYTVHGTDWVTAPFQRRLQTFTDSLPFAGLRCELVWIGAMFKPYSDPRAGTPPSVLNNTAILTSISLYYLTDSFLSSVWISAQNSNGFRTAYTKADTDTPMLFSQYEYNVGLWPQEYVAKVGNLVSYKALIEDIREMGLHFKA